tara:strand:+ start:332 stop:2227 length:1896 start_codon:yes stop_codon:yes gene_type:complete
MEVSLRYADINLYKYSAIEAFSGNQSFKDKSFNLKLKIIEETDMFPELSIGFRDIIGTGKFSSEYIVSSKKIGDFDFTVGLGWGNFATDDGLENPFIRLDNSFGDREPGYQGIGGMLEYDKFFSGSKVSSFYGFEYINKYSGLRFKFDYDSSNPFPIKKKSNYSFGIAIPASKFVDVNIFRHRGTSLGFGVSYKANYSEEIINKNEVIPILNFNKEEIDSLSSNDQIFSGTLNVLLKNFGIFTQSIELKEGEIRIVIENSKYRNLNTSTKRLVQISRKVLKTRDIKHITIIYQSSNVNIGSISFSLERFIDFLDNSYSIPELERHIYHQNYFHDSDAKKIFQGDIDFPIYFGGIEPDLKNHVGAPESFYSGQIGILLGGGIKFSKSSYLDGSISLSIFENLNQLTLKAYSKMPKVRSDIREYLKEKYALKSLSYTHIFNPLYDKNFLFFGGVKAGLLEEMFGGFGGELLFRDIRRPWYFTANYYWVKQRQFNQRLSFRNYETFTGHLNFIWETPLQGVKMIISGGRYLAKDSGVTLNLSKTFKSGFTVGFFATKTDVSTEEFGEGSFDKGIYFSIPLDIVSKNSSKNNARFVWKNLTKDGGAMLSGGLDLSGYVENTSMNFLNYFNDGYKR